ncbi:hypothetical protein COU62_02260 [Candidatus Pacearchaeota archaeon CG10_big_fil_rev_8_21_14_0_10_35_219]|nr:hypothetical protein [Candidatus Pacearchaeota archaeon]PIO07792.1 MAG: hypothetical protein COU62_02260 [Candidatus Pacearchaeota archaeon CG10_big_fil_rev_8_21_14_0_10_35_219]PIY81014.1 MAG: hypothetical protein COY79_04370 [Candidatus Pacearchaeota archaeon CG_4_10_14_0_8_um_filter_35_169]PIZ79883.1 MAG: hypothetical protein COY00_02675 [Candidatus Pacearchaeota archaeon CG_4_10_14_0_2_um_filter_35_33]PJA70279.1 MAG: hypothetical protein CO155_01405 [Candidatus Pacearchaeota archaeon CG_4
MKELKKKQIGIAFGINLIANALWSFLFFGQQEILRAFYDLLLI